MERSMKARVVQTLAALLALLLCATTGLAQPVVQSLATQAQACGQWAEPLTIAIPADRRVSIVRLAELVAEDVSNTQFVATLAAPAGEFPFNRLTTRPPRSLHVNSLSALVGSLYTGGNAEVRAAIIVRLREVIERAGMNYTSLEERRLCCLGRDSNGERVCNPVTGAVCEDGAPPRLVSRNRYLRAGFQDNFYQESFVSGDAFDRADWRDAPAYDLRIFLKPGRRPFVMNIARIYGPNMHPRPAASLCRELPALAAAPPPTGAAGKERIFRRMADLTAATIAEGDLVAAIWATHVVRDVSARVADLGALRRMEQRVANLTDRLQRRWQEIVHVRETLKRADVRRLFWQRLAGSAVTFGVCAIAAGILTGLLLHRKAVKREMSKFMHTLEEELFAWSHMVQGWSSDGKHILALEPANIAEQLVERNIVLDFFRAVREETRITLEAARQEAQSYSRIVLDMVGDDNLASILGISTARSENSGSILMKSGPLTAPRARVVLDSLVRRFWAAKAEVDALRVRIENKTKHMDALVHGVHVAIGAKTLIEVRELLTQALVNALQDEAPTMRRSAIPEVGPPK